jgi:uncharacterized YigZ family protein
MNSIQKNVECEWAVEKSRFIGFLAPVRTLDEMRRFVEKCREDHPGATHVCHACILSTEVTAERASDDGEPQKTAGLPMLEILKKNHLTDILAVTVRYFGGIKLGAGGLIRAYAKTTRMCVDAAVLTFPKEYDECRLVLDYSQSGALEPFLRQNSEMDHPVFGDRAEYRFTCPHEKTGIIAEEIKKRTASDLEVEIVRSVIRYQ